jgi:hypothetical protein
MASSRRPGGIQLDLLANEVNFEARPYCAVATIKLTSVAARRQVWQGPDEGWGRCVIESNAYLRLSVDTSTRNPGLGIALIDNTELGAASRLRRGQHRYAFLVRSLRKHPSIVFVETRQLAEEWTYRYLAAAHAWAHTEPETAAAP